MLPNMLGSGIMFQVYSVEYETEDAWRPTLADRLISRANNAALKALDTFEETPVMHEKKYADDRLWFRPLLQ